MFNISPPKRSSFTAAIRLTVPTAAKATAAFRFRSKMKWALLIGRFLTQSVNRGDNSNVWNFVSMDIVFFRLSSYKYLGYKLL